MSYKDVLKRIQMVDFPAEQYYQEIFEKNQIVLHHTVSGKGVMGDISWWTQSPERVATHIIISRDGGIYQAYSTKYWAHHIGAMNSTFVKLGLKNINRYLNQTSIGIELDSWGGVMESNGKYYPVEWKNGIYVPNTKTSPVDEVVIYKDSFRGFNAFEKYYDAQIQSLKELLIYWNIERGIPLDYHENMWDISKEALSGKKGIWTHVGYREDKSDCHPQPQLIGMLKSLSNKDDKSNNTVGAISNKGIIDYKLIIKL